VLVPRAPLADPSDWARAGNLRENCGYLAHLRELCFRIVVFGKDVLRPPMADNFTAKVGERAHHLGLTLTREPVGRNASLYLEFVHQVEKPPCAGLVRIIRICQREMIDLIRSLLERDLTCANERLECHIQCHGDFCALRP
jgi:hypothetical protein